MKEVLRDALLLRAAKGETISFFGAYDLGFSIFIELQTTISRAFRPTIITSIWLVLPRIIEGSERALQVLRDRVGVLPITPDEWEDVQPVTEKLLKSGFTIWASNIFATLTS